MHPIPMISTEHLARIARLLEACGVPSDRYLERARIPPGAREGIPGFVPGRSVWALAAAADEGEALGEFWLDIARLSDWHRAGWVRHLRNAATLGDALRAMCFSYVRQIPMNQLGLTADEEGVWFWRRRVCDVHDWPGNEPAEQYSLSFMLAVIRSAAADWLPERIRVECAPSGWVSATRSLPEVQVECNQPQLAIHIPRPLLLLPVSIITTALPVEGDEDEAPAPDFQGSLRQILEPWLENGLPSQETAAELLWTSPRTLRRRLAEEGTTWRAVVDDRKFSRAVALLRNGRSSMREIAQELGYSDAAHFSRFFRRRAGVAPGDYLERIERADELARRRRP
jgi:AraC-like DNA-binding protein